MPETRKSMLSRLRILVDSMEEDPCFIDAQGLFGFMVRHAPVGMLLCSADGEIIIANHRLCHAFGWEPSELIGQKVEVLVPTGIRKEHVGQRDGLFAELGSRYMRQVGAVRKDGQEIEVEVGIQTVEVGGDLRLAIVVAAEWEDSDVS